MNSETVDNRGSAAPENNPGSEAEPDQSNDNVADLSAFTRAGETGASRANPIPMGNPKISVEG